MSNQTHVEVFPNVRKSAKLKERQTGRCVGVSPNVRKSAELRTVEVSKVKGKRKVDVYGFLIVSNQINKCWPPRTKFSTHPCVRNKDIRQKSNTCNPPRTAGPTHRWPHAPLAPPRGIFRWGRKRIDGSSRSYNEREEPSYYRVCTTFTTGCHELCTYKRRNRFERSAQKPWC